MNKCMRCKREIKDIRARYGPVCAKIMGVDQQYYRSKLNNRQTAFLQGVSLAKKNLANPAVDTSKIDTKAYMNTMGRYMAALSGNKMDEAVKELQEAKKILDTPKSPPNIDEVVKQINKLNSKTPDFIKNSKTIKIRQNKKQIRNPIRRKNLLFNRSVIPDFILLMANTDGIPTLTQRSLIKIPIHIKLLIR